MTFLRALLPAAALAVGVAVVVFAAELSRLADASGMEPHGFDNNQNARWWWS